MAVQPSYPGVYVEEIPSGSRTIVGVSTSVAAFVGYTPQGPHRATLVLNYGSFERDFGGLHRDSELGYAVRQFFLNGGREAWIVRVAEGASAAAIGILGAPGGTAVLDVEAASPGGFANAMRLDVDYATDNPDASFNLSVAVNGRNETYRNLSMNERSPRYAISAVNAVSSLLRLARRAGAEAAIPAGAAGNGQSLSGELTAGPGDAPPLSAAQRFFRITVDGDGPHLVRAFAAGVPATMNALALEMRDAIRALRPGVRAFDDFTVTAAAAPNHLALVSGTDPASGIARQVSSVVVESASSGDAALTLRLGLANRGREVPSASYMRPAANGTIGAVVETIAGITAAQRARVEVVEGTSTTSVVVTLGAVPTSLADAATLFQRAIRAADPTLGALTVEVFAGRLRVRAGGDRSNALVTILNSTGNLATRLGLIGAAPNVHAYTLGGTTVAAQVRVQAGSDGRAPSGPGPYLGSEADKTGLYALDDVDLVNLVAIPDTARLSSTDAVAVISPAVAWCEAHRAFFLADPPLAARTIDELKTWMNELPKSENGALFVPSVQVADPLDEFRLRSTSPSGTVAGVFARIDAERGVWKAPAGTEAGLTNVQGLAVKLSDPDNGQLNPLGINCLRQFPVLGRIAWGARTLAGADALASEWKYVPVRRLALFLEESLYRGLKWVVFEPNDEPLWARIRLSVEDFMRGLYRQGAFKGESPSKAYFVKVDDETTTQGDIDRGIVNIWVGFAPLKPAEFVILKLQQIAGQGEV